ncbi:hypothetical protein QJS66_00185 [Kocuria rhizophila]|nr:hypothetical protein QJS66_00185 [Kocuria rhizophila]
MLIRRGSSSSATSSATGVRLVASSAWCSWGRSAIGYPAHYIKTRDLKGLRTWARLYTDGMRGRVGGPR